MVVEDVRLDISQNTLSTGGVDITVGTVDEFAASVDQVLAFLVLKGSLGAEGSSNPNAVSVERISRLAQDIIKARRWNSLVSFFRERIGVQITTDAVAEPEIVVREVVRNKGAFDGMGTAVIPAVRVGVVTTRHHGIGLGSQVCRVRLVVLAQRDEIIGQRHLPDTRPVATEVQEWCAAGDDDAGVDGVGAGEWVLARSLACAGLDNRAMVRPVSWSWVV